MGRLIAARTRPRAAVALAGLAALLAAACGGTVTVGSPGISSATAQRLDRAIQGVMRQAAIPGVIVGLWEPGGSYERAFGVADRSTGEPMRSDLYMRIGSETKTFTVTALLQLVDQGKVGLDDAVSKYVSGVPEGDRITLRELARMQSGLVNYTADPDFATALLSDPRRSFTPEQLLAYAFRHPPAFPPGMGFQYSNTNTVLLGLVVEKVSGESLPDYLQAHIFGPLRLTHTSFPTTAAFPSPHAHGYTQQTLDGTQADATDWNPSWGWAAGAMISTLADLHTWAPALATGSLLTPSTQAQRLQTVPDPRLASSGYGLGLFNVSGWIGHNGSQPGYQSLTVYLLSQRATLVVLLNTDTAYQGNAPSTLVGKAITGIVTPGNVYDLPPAPQPAGASPSGAPAPPPSGHEIVIELD